jgi:hypothetical protein
MNKAAQSLGKMGKGVSKTLTAKERRRRAVSLAAARKKRWPVKPNRGICLKTEAYQREQNA